MRVQSTLEDSEECCQTHLPLRLEPATTESLLRTQITAQIGSQRVWKMLVKS